MSDQRDKDAGAPPDDPTTASRAAMSAEGLIADASKPAADEDATSGRSGGPEAGPRTAR